MVQNPKVQQLLFVHKKNSGPETFEIKRRKPSGFQVFLNVHKKNSGPETNVELSAAKPESLLEQTGVFVHKKNSGNPRACSNRPGFLCTKKTPVISRSLNHQSKNEQLIRLLINYMPKRYNGWTCWAL